MPSAVLVVEAPGLGHLLAHDVAQAVARLAAWDEAWRALCPGLRRQGARWVAAGEPAPLVEAALAIVSSRDAAAIVDVGPVRTWAEEPWGYGVWRAGRMVSMYGRAGELFVSEPIATALDPLPAGLGRFAAPEELSRQAGVGLWRIADYR